MEKNISRWKKTCRSDLSEDKRKEKQTERSESAAEEAMEQGAESGRRVVTETGTDSTCQGEQ